MSSILFKPVNPSVIATPNAGKVSLFFDASDSSKPKYKNSNGDVIEIGTDQSIIGDEGMFIAVADLAARDAIPVGDRMAGMYVYVGNTTGNAVDPRPKTFQLGSALQNSSWVLPDDDVVSTIVVSNPSLTNFNLPANFDSTRGYKCYISGILMREGVHYSISGNTLTYLNSGLIQLEVGDEFTIIHKIVF